MVPPGGSSTLYGVLYQLLGSLHRTVHLRVKQRDGGKVVLGARLVIEPPRGGDLRIELPEGGRIVEQWKARTTREPWSLGEIIRKVLPDLYQDDELNHPDDCTEYVFVTEGFARPETRAFLGRLRRPVPEGDPLAGLEDEERSLFPRMAAEVRKRPASAMEPDDLTYRKLRRLLSRFEIKEGQTADRLEREIRRMLLPLIDHADDLDDGAPDKLCMMLLRRGTGKGSEFVPEELLREAGLRAVSLADRAELRRAARELVERRVALRGYDREMDVRPRPDWPAARRYLVLTGGSGQGKTWQLSRLAVDLVLQEKGPLAVFLDSLGDAERDLQKASDLLWTEAWGHDRTIPLQRLAPRGGTTSPAYELLPRLYEPSVRMYERFVRVYELLPRVYERPVRLYERLVHVYERLPRMYEPLPRVYERLVRLYQRLVRVYEPLPRMYEPLPRMYERPVRLYQRLVRVYERLPGMYEPLPHVYERPVRAYAPMAPILQPLAPR